MKGYLAQVLVLCVIAHFGLAQVRVVKPIKTHPASTKLEFGVGMAGSVLYLARNVKENNNARGYQFNLMYGGTRLFRFSAEYTRYQTIDIEPTWYNIKANTAEFNVHIVARFNESKAIFYPLFGISYNTFSGYFTGVNDYLNLTSVYPINQDVVTRWVGLNVGTGYEFYLKRWSFYGEYKMRVGKTEGTEQMNIQDVCLSAGIRYNIWIPTIYRMFKGTRSRYMFHVNQND